MNTRMRKRLIPLVVGAAFCLGSLPSPAQTSEALAKPVAEASSKTHDAKPLAPPPGKMRGMTNDMRKQAAMRNAERKNQEQKAATTTHQQEVKQ